MRSYVEAKRGIYALEDIYLTILNNHELWGYQQYTLLCGPKSSDTNSAVSQAVQSVIVLWVCSIIIIFILFFESIFLYQLVYYTTTLS